MITRGIHEAKRIAEVQLEGRGYTVLYRIRGRCMYDSGRTSGPPEHCYPPESDCEIHDVRLLEVLGDEEGVPCVGERFLALVLAEVNKLPLDEYLLEDWMEQGDDDGQPED